MGRGGYLFNLCEISISSTTTGTFSASASLRTACSVEVWTFSGIPWISIEFFLVYSYFEKGCRKKINVHATIPKGKMGYDQYTVPNDCSCRTYFGCFPLAIANITSQASRIILSNFFEEQCTQNHTQYLSGLSRALLPTAFLEIAVLFEIFEGFH